MISKRYHFLFFVLVTILVTGACALLPATPEPQETDPDTLYTQAAGTVIARLTQQVSETLRVIQPRHHLYSPGRATSPVVPQTRRAATDPGAPTATSVPPSRPRCRLLLRQCRATGLSSSRISACWMGPSMVGRRVHQDLARTK
jgi:hypothetical protein